MCHGRWLPSWILVFKLGPRKTYKPFFINSKNSEFLETNNVFWTFSCFFSGLKHGFCANRHYFKLLFGTHGTETFTHSLKTQQRLFTITTLFLYIVCLWGSRRSNGKPYKNNTLLLVKKVKNQSRVTFHLRRENRSSLQSIRDDREEHQTETGTVSIFA